MMKTTWVDWLVSVAAISVWLGFFLADAVTPNSLDYYWMDGVGGLCVFACMAYLWVHRKAHH